MAKDPSLDLVVNQEPDANGIYEIRNMKGETVAKVVNKDYATRMVDTYNLSSFLYR